MKILLLVDISLFIAINFNKTAETPANAASSYGPIGK